MAHAHRGVGQAVGFAVELAGDVRDGEPERAGQLATDPVQGIEARAAAIVLARHLPDYNLGIRVNMQRPCFQGQGALQSFQQGDVLGDVIVLVTDPAGDFDAAALAAFDYYANARRPRVAQGTAVHVGYEIRHACVVSAANISKITLRVKRFDWFRPSLNFGFFHYPVEGGVEKGEESFCDELKAYTSVN